ncbi:zinc-dependent alcohol dehydrogenase family protein [Aquabacterium humicola]|uniref:zinc-dependent alcohol dehydrogenase family protein n=1 Tax=Aquabacterium humicola TaxID=3237377 RepID=UPI0032EFE2C8
MQAMVLEAPGSPLRLVERALPLPSAGELRLRIEACAVCRTDLHVVDGELALPRLPLVPGHEIVGIVDALGPGVSGWRPGQRAGVPWLAHTCGHCTDCLRGRENLCDAPLFTGHGRDGGFATHVIAEAAYCLPLDGLAGSPAELAPLLCAGLIGWRCLRRAGGAEVRRLGLYGFGAAAHLVTQLALHEGRQVYAFTRPGDTASQDFARSLGAAWAGAADEQPPAPPDAAIIFAPDGALVPRALAAVRKGGRVVCGGIHMSDIPAFAYRLLWQERELRSVANLTRDDGRQFLEAVRRASLHVHVTTYPLARANEALDDLRLGRVQGAAVLVP